MEQVKKPRGVCHHCEGRDIVSAVFKIIIIPRGGVKEPRRFIFVPREQVEKLAHQMGSEEIQSGLVTEGTRWDNSSFCLSVL